MQYHHGQLYDSRWIHAILPVGLNLFPGKPYAVTYISTPRMCKTTANPLESDFQANSRCQYVVDPRGGFSSYVRLLSIRDYACSGHEGIYHSAWRVSHDVWNFHTGRGFLDP